MNDDVWRKSALELAAMVRDWEISPVELARIYLERIERHEPYLHAFMQVDPELTLREARRREKELSGAGALGPFHGVPIPIKDMNLAAGFFTRFGSRAFERLFTPRDCRTVERLRAAGFVVLGKTTVPELATLPHCETRLHPPTRNPWHPEISPGGSSGGAGSALAAGLAPIAQGSDGGGSIRIPSSLCGLYGLKPSRGRVPNAYGFDDTEILYTEGPLAHSVDDAAALLDVLAGVTEGRLHWAPPPERAFLELSREAPPPLRIRFTTRSQLAETHPEVAAAVERGARTLASLGHHVEEGRLPDGDPEDFLVLWKKTASSVQVGDWSLVEPVNRWLASEGRRLGDDRVRRARENMLRPVREMFEGVDLWVTPTIAGAAPRLGTFRDMAPEEAMERARPIAAFTAPFNVSGQPAASLPIGVASAGSPIGLQIVGRPFEDARVLQVSRQLEIALPWSRIHPPGFGWEADELQNDLHP